MNTKVLDIVLLVLVTIGAVNWGLVGFFRFNLISYLFGNMTWLTRVIYAVVGLSGLYMISAFGRLRSMKTDR